MNFSTGFKEGTYDGMVTIDIFELVINFITLLILCMLAYLKQLQKFQVSSKLIFFLSLSIWCKK